MKKSAYLTMITVIIIGLVFGMSSCFFNKANVQIPITNFHSFTEKEMRERKHSKLISKINNQLEYVNENGTKTLYMYSSDITQANIEKGNTVETDIQSVSSENDIIKKFNNVCINFPKTVKNKSAITLSCVDNKMKMYGLVSGNAHETKMQNMNGDLLDMVTYGETKLYSTMQGFCLENELEKGKTSKVDFKIEMENCYTDVSCPEYILFRENVTDNVKAIAYAPVGLSDGELFFGELKITSENKNTNEYFLTSVINNSKNTSVKTSQSFALYLSKQPDSAVYKNKPIINSYLSQYNRIGGENENGETYIRIEDIDKLQIDSSEIESAQLYIHSLNENKVDLHIEPAIDDWCSFTLKWETKPRYDPDMSVKGKKQDNGDVVFNITNIVKKWIDNRGKDAEYTTRKGMVLKNNLNGETALMASNDNGLYGSVLVLEIKK